MTSAKDTVAIDEKIIDLLTAASETAFNAAGECIHPMIGLEFFPPRTEQGVNNLRERLQRLKRVNPLFMDFTWGAGGSTADLTLELTLEAKKQHGLRSNMHLTCTNMPTEKIDSALQQCKEVGIRNIVALRGDPPAGVEEWTVSEGGFRCALDLVKYIKKQHGDYFGISVAGYPEGHPDRIKLREQGLESLSEAERLRCSVDAETGAVHVCSDQDWEEELAYLKAKCDAGADVIITQMFFDPAVYGRFVAECRRVGITAPVIPGLMCINAFGGFKRMTGFCKTRVPAQLSARIEAIKDNEVAVKALGVDYGEEMCRSLLHQGAPCLHFYTLNLEKVTVGILRRLGLAGSYDEAAPKHEDTAQMLEMIKSGGAQVPRTLPASAAVVGAAAAAAAATKAAPVSDAAPAFAAAPAGAPTTTTTSSSSSSSTNGHADGGQLAANDTPAAEAEDQSAIGKLAAAGKAALDSTVEKVAGLLVSASPAR